MYGESLVLVSQSEVHSVKVTGDANVRWKEVNKEHEVSYSEHQICFKV